tara:strand:- start:191 stop:490 length:300 start_codon:yes stop_codon:yes gene_type:complete
MSEVKIVRLCTGEEVLCKAEQTDSGWKLNKAALIVPADRAGSIGLMGWMPYTKSYETGIEVKDKDVMFVSEPHDELLNEYNQAFGSGLVVPKKQQVSGA